MSHWCAPQGDDGAEAASDCGTPRPCLSYHPPSLVQATVNDQKLTEPTPSVAWTRVLLARRNLRDTRADRVRGFEAEVVVHKQRVD